MPNGYPEGNVVVVSQYVVQGRQQRTLADFLEGQVRSWICNRPGYLFGSVSRGVDDTHLVVSTTWDGARNGIDFLSCSEGKALFAVLTKSGAQGRESFVYYAGDVIDAGAITLE